ncbi:NADP-dependent oxidoreductase [Corynebacterium falsenii]|uniref:NADP-dependent oxidoreductase n=1 Tax=Corynebacterium falsenii TaxID=108486 RepID=UPI001E0B12B3|nr:NADP-dependent oxidoreductase [Corynebacterium falsenii]HJF12566.1 NADP-dependent oxidoreductase [Corynebacterium falsenii]
MRIYGFDSYGGPEVQRFLEVPDPTSAEGTPGGVAIETTAVGLNPGDIKVRSGQRQGAFPVESPMAMGREAAGRVISSDPSTGLSAGDRVFGSCLAGVGALGEVTILDATSTTPIPDAVEDFQAACLPVAAGTAWDALHELNAGDPNAEKPQRVLVLGAGGGVGTFAVQMARYLGCSVVGVASSAKKLLVERLGAHHVDYAEFLNQSVNQSIEVTREVAREIIGPVDAIVDAAGGDSLRILAGLAPEGAIRSAADPALASELGGRGIQRRRTREVFAELADLVAAGAVTPVINNQFSFDHAADAVKDVETGHSLGKTVVRL